MYLAIDPGLSTGWAVVDASGVLRACGAGEGFPRWYQPPGGEPVPMHGAIIERPQVYVRRRSKGDPNDLITLAIRLGRYVERLAIAGIPCNEVLPTTWKGSIDKGPHHLRVSRALPEAEKELVIRVAKRAGARGYDDNVWDAVALAKWAFVARQFAIAQNVR